MSNGFFILAPASSFDERKLCIPCSPNLQTSGGDISVASSCVNGVQEKAPDGKDYLSGPTRQFSDDATRDEANQEEGPGSDPVPKDGPL